MKPVELMNDKEREAYYLARRRAMLAGDDGVLPDGRTVRETREQYIEQCNADPMRTRTYGEALAQGVMDDDDLPKGVVATPESEIIDPPELANKRCCG